MQPLWKNIWDVLRKLKVELPFDSVIPLLGFFLCFLGHFTLVLPQNIVVF